MNGKGKVNMATDLVLASDIHYFRMKWGEKSKSFERASTLLKVLSESQLPRLRHYYTMPDKFGFEVGAFKPIVWTNSRNFVESVVESFGIARWPKQIYRDIVNYLVKENAVSRTVFKVGYYDVSENTFSHLYNGINEHHKRTGEELLNKQTELSKNINEWKQSTTAHVYAQLETSVMGEALKSLLADPKLDHDILYDFFDPADVDSLKKIALSIQPSTDVSLLVEQSSVGERIRRYINDLMSKKDSSV